MSTSEDLRKFAEDAKKRAAEAIWDARVNLQVEIIKAEQAKKKDSLERKTQLLYEIELGKKQLEWLEKSKQDLRENYTRNAALVCSWTPALNNSPS